MVGFLINSKKMVFNRRFNEGTVLYKILIGYKLIFKILKATYVLNILMGIISLAKGKIVLCQVAFASRAILIILYLTITERQREKNERKK